MTETLGPPPVAGVLTPDEFELLAPPYLSEMALDYIRGGAGDEHTLAANRAAFNRIQLWPRVLRDVSSIDTSLTLFGQPHKFPILLAPTGYHKLFHPQGELATAEGAAQAGVTFVASSFATVSFADTSRHSPCPLWFQLYVQPDRAITRDIVQTVVEAGCRALCLTVDIPVNGPRDRELRSRFTLPSGLERANLRALGPAIASAAHRPQGRDFYNPVRAPDVTWRDVEWLRALSPVPLLIKGVLHPDDARAAVDCGCDGIVVSNHGGRSLDTVPPAIEVLPLIAEATAGSLPLLVDGGVRRGIDVFKALALGAKAVMIGRPYLYALAVGGAAGVARVVEILHTELQMTMGLAGCASLTSIDRSFLYPGRC